ncbi:MAG: winged helix-turn-helix domain-containing protein [Candidatus Aramenus sp.]|nr:winged helix-turn-helix domain-containing protein [Candidatus Aramenus sp.]
MTSAEYEGLYGTRKKIYYYILRQRKPVPLKKIQRDLNLSSPSLVQYHLKKLLEEGLVKETQEGYVVSKVVLSDYVRISNHLIPVSAFFASFFITALALLLAFLYKYPLASEIFSAIVISISAVLFAQDVIRKYKEIKL